jgi:hypothetical protein
MTTSPPPAQHYLLANDAGHSLPLVILAVPPHRCDVHGYGHCPNERQEITAVANLPAKLYWHMRLCRRCGSVWAWPQKHAVPPDGFLKALVGEPRKDEN